MRGVDLGNEAERDGFERQPRRVDDDPRAGDRSDGAVDRGRCRRVAVERLPTIAGVDPRAQQAAKTGPAHDFTLIEIDARVGQRRQARADQQSVGLVEDRAPRSGTPEPAAHNRTGDCARDRNPRVD